VDAGTNRWPVHEPPRPDATKKRHPGALGGVQWACSQYKWSVTALSSSSAAELYVRVSTADQRTDSPTEELKTSCISRGYSKVRPFVEKQFGAKVTRPQLDAMMGEIRTGQGLPVRIC